MTESLITVWNIDIFRLVFLVAIFTRSLYHSALYLGRNVHLDFFRPRPNGPGFFLETNISVL